MNFPTLHGNWVDLVIIIFLLLSLFEGLKRGFLAGLLDFSGFLLSFLSALKFYGLAAAFLVANFSLPPGIAKALGFFLVGILTELILFWLAGFGYPRIPKKFAASISNRLLGILPALGETLVFLTFVLVLTLALPVSGFFKSSVLNAKIGKVLVLQTQGIERDLKQIFGEAASEVLNFLTIEPESQERVDLRFTQRELRVDELSENQMLVMVNQERQKQGLSALVLDERLRQVARAHSQEMFERGYFSHYSLEGLSPFDRLAKAGINFGVAGENLALAPDVKMAMTGLMKSPSHRENILSAEFKRLGIGVIDGGVYGKMFTQNFTD